MNDWQNDASWRARSDETIAQHRRRPLTVRVVDSGGDPIPGADVHIEQTRHHYLFANIIANGFYPGYMPPIGRRPAIPQGTRAQVLNDMLALYNGITLENAGKWAILQPEDAPPDYAMADWIVDWARAHDLTVKGHTLIWGNLREDRGDTASQGVPGWVYERDLEGEALAELLEDHIRETVTHFGEAVQLWDVVNEALHCHYYEERLPDYVERAFRAAREYAPWAVLILNEYNVISGSDFDAFIDQVKGLLDAGAPVDAVGVQVHEWRKRPILTPDDLYARFDTLAEETGLPIYVSEFSIEAGTVLNGRVVDEDYQAALYEMVHRVCFGHPAVAGITTWGFWDASIWQKGAGVLREDLSHKPAYDALHHLIKDEWWTSADWVTSADGTASGEVTAGDYGAAVSLNGEEVPVEAHRAETTPDGGLLLEIGLSV